MLNKNKKVFLDYNSTTPVRKEVVEAMLPYFTKYFGNPSSGHCFGRKARRGIDIARNNVAKLIGAKDDEIVFTSGGTESNNLALLGMLPDDGPAHIITSEIEHSSLLRMCEILEGMGHKITYLPVNENGTIVLKELKKKINRETTFISIMLANNETGVIQPVQKVTEIAREYNVPVHCDAVQACGKIPFSVGALGVSLLSISGHKFYSPKGVGALYIRRGIRPTPLIHGGSQENRRRAGTENLASVVGMGKSCELILEELEEYNDKISSLRDYLENELVSKIPGTKVNGIAHRVPNTLNISFIGASSEAMVASMDMKGFAISSASACSSGSSEPSYVIKAMTDSTLETLSAVRISIGRETTKKDLNAAVKAFTECVETLRK